MSETKNFIKHLLYDLAIFGIILSLVSRFGVGISNVNSGSMEGSVLTGDNAILLPWVYGGKTPQTPLSIPFVHQPTLLGFRTYLPWIQLPVTRAPGYKPKKGEVVSFAPTVNDEFGTYTESQKAHEEGKKKTINRHPADTKTPFLKRVVATAGDLVKIDDTQVLADGAEKDDFAKHRQYCYRVSVSAPLSTTWLNKNTNNWNLPEASRGKHQYELFMTLAQKKNLENHLKAKDITLHEIKSQPCEGLKTTEGNAGIRNDMKEIVVPYHYWNPDKKQYASLTIQLNKDTHPVYVATLENTDANFRVEKKDDEVRYYLKGKQIFEYTFKENFFFPIGDNFHDSRDGRSFGFVPYSHLNAKAYRVLFNYQSWKAGKGWRFLHKIPGTPTNESNLLLLGVFLLVLLALIGGTWFIIRRKE